MRNGQRTFNCLLAAALDYAKRGLPVMPLHSPFPGGGCSCGRAGCKSVGKHPRSGHGLRDATTEPDTIRQWWNRWPDANLGIRTGSGLLVLDVDGDTGRGSLETLTRQHGPLPDTLESATGRGAHLFFRYTGGEIRSGVAKLGPGLDVRAEGGYVVAPPSIHVNGKEYQWTKDLNPASLPDWLLETLQAPPTGKNAATVAAKRIPEGQRNEALTSIAGSMRKRGMTQEAIEAALLADNRARCDPPLPDYEIQGIARSVARYPSSQPDGDGQPGRTPDCNRTKAATMLELIDRASPVLFHTETGEPFARVKVTDHFENLPVQSAEFAGWLRHLAWRATKVTVNSETLEGVRGVLEARAQFDGPVRRLHNRVAWQRGAIWYDLADKHWHAIKVTPDDWQLEVNVPILFRRYAHQSAQVVPIRAGRLSEAEPFLNLKTETDGHGHTLYDERYLFLAALATYLIPDIPHPIIVLYGEHGAAKTTLSRLARELIDPSATPTLGEPRREEIGQWLQHHYMLPFDNLNFLPGWLSDTLCRAVTGDGLSKRRLYTDEQDVIFAYRRCILLNGINAVVSRADLLDRSILLECQPIPDNRRQPEREFWGHFEGAKARILGGMFNALSRAMSLKSGLCLPRLPRMADFAEWGSAIAEASGWGQRAFLEAYNRESDSRNFAAVDSNPVAQVLVGFTENHQDWSGTAAELLATLRIFASDAGNDIRAGGWPRQPHILSRRINEAIPNLRRLGIRVTHRWRGSQKLINLVRSDGKQDSDGSEGSVGFDENASS